MDRVHTPGPWGAHTVRTRWADDQALIVFGPDETTPVAVAADFNRYDRDAEVEANARLIAAAPDLLAVLESIYVDLVDYSKRLSGAYDTGAIALGSCADQVAAVIAKAKGEASSPGCQACGEPHGVSVPCGYRRGQP